MSQNTTTGTSWAIAQTYGTASNITAATNAAECVVTLGAGHGVVLGDFLHLSVGWARGNDRVFRAKTVATNDVTLEGFNTTSTANFPVGGGVGTLRRITAWSLVTQVRKQDVGGGDQQYVDGSYLENPIDIDIPNSKSPIKITLTTADDMTLAYRTVVQAAQDAGLPVGMRRINSLGRITVGAGYWSLQPISTGDRNAVEETQIMCSLANDITRYAS